MRIADLMTLVVPSVTDLLRRSRTAGGTHEQQPMFPTIIAIRNDRVVGTVSTPRMPATLSCAQTLAVGLDPQALVVAAEGVVDGGPMLVYTMMTRERTGKVALQEIKGEGEQVTFSVPFPAEPQDQTILRVLAEALGQPPMDVTRVARKDLGGTFGEQQFLPAEQGRVVVDAGTLSTLHTTVKDIAGQVLYIARSPEAGKLALEAGLPRACLLSA